MVTLFVLQNRNLEDSSDFHLWGKLECSRKHKEWLAYGIFGGWNY